MCDQFKTTRIITTAEKTEARRAKKKKRKKTKTKINHKNKEKKNNLTVYFGSRK